MRRKNPTTSHAWLKRAFLPAFTGEIGGFVNQIRPENII